MKTTLKRPKTVLDWWKVYRLYNQAFPPSERKPFSIILRMTRQKRTDTWMVLREGRFSGFATTINSDMLVMLDYLAMEKQARGQGIGTDALRLLLDTYAGRGFFVEIEDPFAPGDDRHDRQRRRQFYQNCGLTPLGVMAKVFGVDMELLGRDCRLDFAGYRAFYADRYSAFAAGNLQELPHPETPR